MGARLVDTYTYQGGILCDACADLTKAALDLGGVADDGDSETYPQLVTDDGEADSPQHCSRGEDCINSEEHEGLPRPVGMFLENPLTDDGIGYVAQQIQQCPRSPIVRMWAEFYGI